MPHLQASSADSKHLPANRGLERTNPNGANIPLPATASDQHLPIQEASKGYLGISDPVVAMANRAEQAEKVSFDESVEGGTISLESVGSPMCASKSSKSFVTPSPNASQSRLLAGTAAANSKAAAAATPGSPVSSTSSSEGGPILTIYGNSRLFHSPIRVKRRVSHSEDDVVDDQAASAGKNLLESQHLRYGGESPTETAKPILIRRGSSMGKRRDATEDQEENDTKRQKTEQSSSKKDDAEAAAAHEAAVEAASAMAGMRKKPVISPGSSGERRDEGGGQPHAGSSFDHYQRHQNPYYAGGAPPGYPLGHGTTYGYGYHGGSYGGYIPPYYPPYHGSVPLPLYHGYGQPAPLPYSHAMRSARAAPEAPCDTSPPVVALKRNSSNGHATARSSPTHTVPPTGTFHAASTWQQPEKPVSTDRCMPIKDPLPSKSWTKEDKTKDTVLPDFHRIVNYPDFLTKARNDASCLNGKRNCVMCGKLRICSASSSTKNGRNGAMPKAHQHMEDEDTCHIIPRQNKGLCTACDVTVWMVVEDGLEIKWCKGCKNFRPWAAFGSKGTATKCVRCRDRQREKYAMQRDELRSRRSQRDSSVSPTDSESAASGSEKEEKPHVTAAQGLHSLLSAATSV